MPGRNRFGSRGRYGSVGAATMGKRGFVGFACFSVEVDIGPSAVAILTPIGNDIYCMTAAVDQTALGRGARLATRLDAERRAERRRGRALAACDPASDVLKSIPAMLAGSRRESVLSACSTPLRLLGSHMQVSTKPSQLTFNAHGKR